MKTGKSTTNKIRDLTIEVEKSIDKWKGVGDSYEGFVKSKDNEKPIWWISIIIIVFFLVMIIMEYSKLNSYPTSENHDNKSPFFSPNARSLTIINIILFFVSVFSFFSVSKQFNDLNDRSIFYVINLIVLCSVQFFYIYNLVKANDFSEDSTKRFRPASMALLVWICFSIFDIVRIINVHHALLIMKIIELCILILQFIFLYFYDDAQTFPFIKL